MHCGHRFGRKKKRKKKDGRTRATLLRRTSRARASRPARRQPAAPAIVICSRPLRKESVQPIKRTERLSYKTAQRCHASLVLIVLLLFQMVSMNIPVTLLYAREFDGYDEYDTRHRQIRLYTF